MGTTHLVPPFYARWSALRELRALLGIGVKEESG